MSVDEGAWMLRGGSALAHYLAVPFGLKRVRYQAACGARGSTWRLAGPRHRFRCAGVEPHFVEYDGDAAAYIVSANVHRRHLSTGQQAAGEALSLLAQGRRKGERWEYGALPENPDSRVSRHSWTDALRHCGVIADVDVSLLRLCG